MIARITFFILIVVLHNHAIGSTNGSNKILVLGDSLSAAYGIQIEEGWVALLEAKLPEDYSIVNASISGETTDGGLRALPQLLEQHAPEIVIIELGANDGLRGFPLPTIKQNLHKLVELANASARKVMLLGMHIPPNYGPRYASAFHELFQSTAEEYDTALVPFLLEGVATNPELMQNDQLHPTAEAQPTIMKLVWDQLHPLL